MDDDDDFALEEIGGWAGVASSVEDLETGLRACSDVPRWLRRKAVGHARQSRRVLLAEGVPAESIFFKFLRCECCDQFELSVFDARGRAWH